MLGLIRLVILVLFELINLIVSLLEPLTPTSKVSDVLFLLRFEIYPRNHNLSLQACPGRIGDHRDSRGLLKSVGPESI